MVKSLFWDLTESDFRLVLIDTDFCIDRRGEVIDYVVKKYGEDKDWNIDLIPKIMLRNSPIIKLFLITDIYNYNISIINY